MESGKSMPIVGIKKKTVVILIFISDLTVIPQSKGKEKIELTLARMYKNIKTQTRELLITVL
jgi:TATA-box binding protein (TBP) (component of TFIID and TFIIIB)